MSSGESNLLGYVPENMFRDSRLSEGGRSPSFFQKISAMQEVEINTETLSSLSPLAGKNKNYGDPFNTYRLNSLGFRGEEFKKVPLLVAGCSMTFGVGVPADGSWGDLLAKKLDLPYSNLSAPGWSIQAIVDNILKYIWQYGKPDTLAVIFPDYNRALCTREVPVDTSNSLSTDTSVVDVYSAILPHSFLKERPKYSKAPHKYTEFMPPEYGLLQAFKSINFLISYCKALEIDFIWSTWNTEFGSIIEVAKNNWNQESYKYYSPIPHMVSGCHEEYLQKYGENFYRGFDGITNDSNSPSHYGVHAHIHFSEMFYKKIKNL